MFALARRPHETVRIDLGSVRDTLLYIESDLTVSPEYAKLAAAVREALAEVARLEASGRGIEKRAPAAARFVPARL